MALWPVVGTGYTGNKYFRKYIVKNGMEYLLSEDERAFLLRNKYPILFGNKNRKRDEIKFTWKNECLYFLAWCAGLIDNIEIPLNQSNVESILDFFLQEMEKPVILRKAIRLRDKEEIMAWADLLYRLHWATRNAFLKGEPMPANLDGDVIEEWHLAVNWMIRYGNEDNWDDVPTDT